MQEAAVEAAEGRVGRVGSGVASSWLGADVADLVVEVEAVRDSWTVLAAGNANVVFRSSAPSCAAMVLRVPRAVHVKPIARQDQAAAWLPAELACPQPCQELAFERLVAQPSNNFRCWVNGEPLLEAALVPWWDRHSKLRTAILVALNESGVLPRLLELQRLSQELPMEAYERLAKLATSTGTDQDPDTALQAALAAEPTNPDWVALYRYCLAATFRDCSIFITLATSIPTNEAARPEQQPPVVLTSVKVVDLDLKRCGHARYQGPA
ncbi:uncharacterized protein MONBRDRAFT_7372 [Monosiga brevicollis MX1]|uniref:Inositol-pentakisphosphate 2-kinase n=1 Tax=Monosiga brevicollis TaxID=81824 RepID=A9UWR9_MONBE|nr:uncharacterized protein MONBRDRAFT_7372 [Monosiga brevicollis MX1]EDQ90090.1 predicted protein [Monosiga brevicollis MX1]|eukprot:XP_001744857.1 hypothetical protein [Monosiga brevicollis MX1]